MLTRAHPMPGHHGTTRALDNDGPSVVGATEGDRCGWPSSAHREHSRFRTVRARRNAGTVVLLALLVGTEPVSNGIQLRSAVRCVLPRLDKSVVRVAGHDVDMQVEHVLPPCRAVRLEER